MVYLLCPTQYVTECWWIKQEVEKGIPSPFEGELGWHAVGDVENYAPLIFRRVRDECDIRELDTSQFAWGNDLCNTHLDNREEEIKNLKNSGEEKTYKILRMKNIDFRDKLVTSFHRRWAVNDIVWPSRTGEMKAWINKILLNCK